MVSTQIAPGLSPGNRTELSADNTYPERHIVMDTLRAAAPLLGLRAPVIATLDAMLSCLAPRRNHHTVFASNATLAFRRNGISDRTLRRHVEILRDAGLLVRRDSPNGKRYTRRSAMDGCILRFGFDLAPLFQRLREIAGLAAQARKEQEKIAYIKCKLRAACADMLAADPENETAQQIHRALRRKLTVSQCQDLHDVLSAMPACTTAANETTDPAENLSASDGQNVRHHHKSKKELIDKELTPTQPTKKPAPPISVDELKAACPEACEFAMKPIQTHDDFIAHAATLGPMLGIGRQEYEASHQRLGALETAMTICAIVQFHGRIRSVGAYFRAITTGSRSAGFDPVSLIRQLAARQDCTT